MKRFSLAVAVLFVSVVVPSLVLRHSAFASTAQKAAKVEYKVVDYSTADHAPELQAFLDGMGRDGWKLVTVNIRGSSSFMIFTR